MRKKTEEATVTLSIVHGSYLDEITTASLLGRYKNIATADSPINKYKSMGFFPKKNRTNPKIPIISDMDKVAIVAIMYPWNVGCWSV